MSQQLQGIDTRGFNMDPKQATSLHVPTFAWAVVAFLVALLLYHMIWGK